ncbi:lipid A deacylase LpxR family protein [Niveibacterium terrae]|uniref:lipid A deacylase LpxR family protein n=1 Tax=Niveibacterium terrae TaxID=3373598 RepID=UPI003A954DEF
MSADRRIRFIRRFFALPGSAILIAACAAQSAHADERFFTFTGQNDIFFGNDGGGYTNGVVFGMLRAPSPGEPSVAPPVLLARLASALGTGKPVLASSSLAQFMVTPRDKSRSVPAAADSPYIGVLQFRSAQVTVREQTADLIAVDLGVVGTASGAAQTQRFVHRLFGSEGPRGWGSQGRNRLLAGLEAYRARRFQWSDTPTAEATSDFILLGGATLGNLESSFGGTALIRYGRDLERSFPTVVRVQGRSSDPFVIGRGCFAYAGYSADRFTGMRIGDDTPAGNPANLRKSAMVALAGIAFGWGESSLTLSLQSASPFVVGNSERQSFGSITFTTRIP